MRTVHSESHYLLPLHSPRQILDVHILLDHRVFLRAIPLAHHVAGVGHHVPALAHHVVALAHSLLVHKGISAADVSAWANDSAQILNIALVQIAEFP